MKKKDLRIGIGVIAAGIAVAVFFLVVMPQLQSQPQPQPQTSTADAKIGLVIMPSTETPTLAEIQKVYVQAASTGIGRSNVYMSWPNIEPQEGQYNWKLYDVLMGLNREQHLNATLYFSVINNEAFGPFPKWISKPALDEKLANETATTLNAILSRYYIVDNVIIGGNVDIYFRDHPKDIPKYVDFFNSVYKKVKEKHPDVKIGNWFSLNDLINHYDGDLVQKLDQGDFVAYSYAPVDLLYYQNKSPEQEGQDLQKMLDFANGKKIALMEVGWSTDKAVNGTADDQAKFVKIVFDFYRKHQSQFEFLTWYRQYDRPFETCYSGLNTNIQTGFNNNILLNNTAHYLCGTGLIDSNLKPKPAWSEFMNQVKASS